VSLKNEEVLRAQRVWPAASKVDLNTKGAKGFHKGYEGVWPAASKGGVNLKWAQ